MSYLPVQSNDTLRHLSLPNAPETLCGKIVISAPPTPYSRDISEQTFLDCDLCAALSGGDSILKQTQAGRECPDCDDNGLDASGLPCLHCGGSRWLDEGEGEGEYANDLLGLDMDDLKGTKVAVNVGLCQNGCGRSISGMSVNVGNQEWCVNCASTPPAEKSIDLNQKRPYDQDEERKTAAWDSSNSPKNYQCSVCGNQEVLHPNHTESVTIHCPKCSATRHYDYIGPGSDPQPGMEREATNWTRDGAPIEDGFTVMITKEQAARTPFLDYSRVSVSERRECPDCGERHWLNRISSCTGCDGLKCSGCMETIQLDGFLGTCKKCAGADSDLSYETNYEDSFGDADRYLTYIMQDDDTETDPFFLPNNSD